MIDFLTGHIFQCIILPVITTLLTILIRIIARPDKIGTVDRNTFNVGVNLCVTAIFVLATKCIILAKEIKCGELAYNDNLDLLVKLGVECFAMVVGLIVVAFITRKVGWEQVPYSQNCRLKIFWGVIFPDIVGILYLVWVFYQASLNL